MQTPNLTARTVGSIARKAAGTRARKGSGYGTETFRHGDAVVVEHHFASNFAHAAEAQAEAAAKVDAMAEALVAAGYSVERRRPHALLVTA